MECPNCGYVDLKEHKDDDRGYEWGEYGFFFETSMKRSQSESMDTKTLYGCPNPECHHIFMDY